MTITREQLELAARAYSEATGTRVARDGNLFVTWNEYGSLKGWNPQYDHGQLHDLAMACKIKIDPNNNDISYFLTEERLFKDWRVVNVGCQDFPALADAVIQAAAEQQMAKEGK